MKFWQILSEGYTISVKAIISSKFRSMLTMLGISIGIFAITIISTLVYSLENSITKNLSALGNTVLYVHHWPWKDNSQDWFKYFNRPKVSYSDYLFLKNNLDNVEGVCFEMSRGGQTVKSGKNSLENISVKGVTADFGLINDMKFQEGRYFTPIEVNAGRNVCILGNRVARELLEEGPYIDKIVRFQGKKLVVIGVLESEGSGIFGDTPDDRLFVPYPIMAKIFNAESRKGDKLIIVRAKNYQLLERVEDDVRGLIRTNRGLKPSMEDNFAINKQEMLMTQLDAIFGALRTGGIFISFLSILVGGFGIANIMFVSVKERTNEIGIQKSLGATRTFILTQFLMEAVLLCIFGGAMLIL